jgi:hypothetical protein
VLTLWAASNRNLTMMARRRGLPDPPHCQLWNVSRLNLLREHFGLPVATLGGFGARPPATDERFGADGMWPAGGEPQRSDQVLRI